MHCDHIEKRSKERGLVASTLHIHHKGTDMRVRFKEKANLDRVTHTFL